MTITIQKPARNKSDSRIPGDASVQDYCDTEKQMRGVANSWLGWNYGVGYVSGTLAPIAPGSDAWAMSIYDLEGNCKGRLSINSFTKECSWAPLD